MAISELSWDLIPYTSAKFLLYNNKKNIHKSERWKSIVVETPSLYCVITIHVCKV